MKVSYSAGMGTLSGRYREIVYCHSRKYGYTYARQRVYPTLTEVNAAIGSKSANIWRLEPSEAYKGDLRSYVEAHDAMRRNYRTPLRAWSCLYTKLMYALEREYPAVDLRSITRQEIYAADLPCISIRKAVEAGLLAPVKGWESMDKELCIAANIVHKSAVCLAEITDKFRAFSQ